MGALAWRRRLAGLAAGGAAALVVGLAPAVVAGADEASRVTVRVVDATGYPEVAMAVMAPGATLDGSAVTVTQDGQVMTTTVQSLGMSGQEVGIVFVIDTSRQMEADGRLELLKAALADRVAAREPFERFALVTYGTSPRVVSDLTSDSATLTHAISSLVAEGREEASQRDGIRAALQLLSKEPDVQPNLVVVGASRDLSSSAAHNLVRSDVLAANAVVFGVGITSDDYGGTTLADLATRTGGTYAETANPADLGALLEGAVGAVDGQALVTYEGPADATIARAEITVGGSTGKATFNVGTVTEARNLNPKTSAPTLGTGPSFLQGTAGKYVGAGAALVAVTLLAWGVGLVLVRDRSALATVLQPYSDGYVASDDDASAQGLAETKLMQRAVEFTEHFARRQGFLPRLEQSLERADLPLRAGEALFFYVAIAAALALLSFLLLHIIVALVAIILLVLLPPAILNFMASRRRAKFMGQLPDTLQLLAGSLRAGYSLMQGIEAVSQEVSDPMGRELRRIVVESRLGRPLEVAMEDSASRMGSPDFAWAVMAIRIQREVGGNLAELLMTVAETMIHRERLRRDVKALIAEGKMSAIVLGILPPGLGMAMYVINPGYIRTLFEDRTGQMMLGGSILLAVAGFLWMKKTVEVEV